VRRLIRRRSATPRRAIPVVNVRRHERRPAVLTNALRHRCTLRIFGKNPAHRIGMERAAAFSGPPRSERGSRIKGGGVAMSCCRSIVQPNLWPRWQIADSGGRSRGRSRGTIVASRGPVPAIQARPPRLPASGGLFGRARRTLWRGLACLFVAGGELRERVHRPRADRSRAGGHLRPYLSVWKAVAMALPRVCALPSNHTLTTGFALRQGHSADINGIQARFPFQRWKF